MNGPGARAYWPPLWMMNEPAPVRLTPLGAAVLAWDEAAGDERTRAGAR